MSLPYTFEPLFDFLEQLDMTLDDLVTQNILLKQTADKIKNGQPVMLSTAAKICISLGCDMSDIVALNYAYESSGTTEETGIIEIERPYYNPWFREEEDRLIDELNRGLSLAEIAKAHNRSEGGIKSRIRRLTKAGRIKDPTAPVPAVPKKHPKIPAGVPDAPEDGISISELARRISERTQRKVKYEDIASWLIAVGDLFEKPFGDGKIIRIPTKQGENHGIKRGKKKNFEGIEYAGVFLEPSARRYIIDNLPKIIAFLDTK